MPILRCHKNGLSGWKYGQAGFCYTGPNGRTKAVEQAQAVHANKREDQNRFVSSMIARKRNFLFGDKGRRLKRVPRFILPDPIERRYRTALIEILKNIEDQTRKIIFPHLEGLVQERDYIMKTDSWAESADRIIETMKVSVGASGQILPGSLAGDIGQKTADWNDRQWRRQLRTVLGIDVLQREQWLQPMLTSFTKENVGLIKSITDKSVSDIEGMVQRGISSGQRFTKIRDQIEEQFDVNRRRATLIARDQVSKLNGQITMARQKASGIEHYIWRTSMDERVRPSHAEKEGMEFSWDNPPEDTGNPGEDIQCRCTAEPVITELLEE
jgi:SPP1 gp7 family putative phage head morphogenesis protein